MLVRCVFLGGILLCNPCFLTAQSVHVGSNQLLALTNHAILYTPGTITNQGVILNEGNIWLEGNWNNQQSYNGEGWLRFTGTENQTIQHNGQNISALEVSGGGLKILEGSITIVDTLQLTDGHVVATPENSITLNQNILIDGASVNSYIEGAVRFSGTGYHYLPIGTSTSFLPITLEEVGGVSPVVEVVAFDGEPVEVDGERLEAKTVNNYWTINELEGSYDGSVVTLPVTSADRFDDLIGVVVTESDNLEGPFRNLGQQERVGDRNAGFITGEAVARQSIISLGLTSEYVLDNSVEVPSAFSPVASNPTDRTVKIYSANLRDSGFSWSIFNRWGQIVYQTSDLPTALNSGWNGLDPDSNQPLPPGIYPYVVRGIYDTGLPVEQTGSITLFH